MFGFRFVKFAPTNYVLEYVRGQVRRQGAGLAFFYFGPTTTLVQIPVGSTDAPFIFTETTADFQEVTVQGTDGQKLDAIFGAGSEPTQIMARAFQELAAGAEKIGELNISPDLLREIMTGRVRGDGKKR